MTQDNNNFCVICVQGSGCAVNYADSLVTVGHFYKLLGRFCGASDFTKLLLKTENLFGKPVKCCVKCEGTIGEFCKVYHQLTCLELQLDRILNKVVDKVQLANKIPARWAKVNKLLENTFVNDNVNKGRSQDALRMLRQSVVKAGRIRSAKSSPRVKIRSIQPNSKGSTTLNDRIGIEENTDNTPASTLGLLLEPIIIPKTEYVQAERQHHFGTYEDEQTVPEPPSSLVIGDVFAQVPVKSENNLSNFIHTTIDISPEIGTEDSILTPAHSYSLRGSRVSRFINDNDNESNIDNDLDIDDLSSNYDNSSDDSKTRRPTQQNTRTSIHVDARKLDTGNENLSGPGGKRPRKCDECEIWLKNRQALHAHNVKYHRDPVKCPVCKKSYSRVDNLKRHILRLHGNSDHAIKFKNKIKTSRQVVARNRYAKVLS